MRTIYFVDDEQSVLDGLRRMLRDLRREWQMSFFANAQSALDAMASSPPDVVVSDMRMPGMDGSEFLRRVQKLHPGSIRIVLSGHAEFDAISRVMRSAHQILSKPCDADHLRAVLKNAGFLLERLENGSIASAIAGLGALPSIPAVLQELLELLDSPEVDQRVIASMVERDPALCVRILQVANSGFFGARSRIESVGQAIVMLGAEMLKNLVIQVKIVESFPSSNSSFSLESFGNRVALLTKLALAIAPQDVDFDDLRNLAMTADVGQLVLAARLPDRYERVLQEHRLTKRALVEVEDEILSVNHAAVGSYLMGLWGLDSHTINQIANHHTPLKAGEDEALTTVVHAAESLVECEGDEDRLALIADPSVLEMLRSRPELPEWLALVAGAQQC